VIDSEISGGEVVSLNSLTSFYDFLKSKGIIVPEKMTLEKLNEWSTQNGYGATYKVNSTTNSGNHIGIVSFMSVSS
jgi:hypothetical protein